MTPGADHQRVRQGRNTISCTQIKTKNGDNELVQAAGVTRKALKKRDAKADNLSALAPLVPGGSIRPGGGHI